MRNNDNDIAPKEILLTRDEIQKALSLLPDKGPASQAMKINADGSVKASVLLTSPEISPKAEIHENFNDLFLAQAGEEEFWVGGEIIDKTEVEPGEWLGEKLVDAQRHMLKSDDILIVPKGVPHKHGAGTATFLIIKTK